MDFSSAPPPISLSLSLLNTHTRTHTHTEGRRPRHYIFPVLFFYSADPLVNLPIIQKKGSMWVLIGSCHSRGRHHQKNKTSTICRRRRRRSRPFFNISTHPVVVYKRNHSASAFDGGDCEKIKKGELFCFFFFFAVDFITIPSHRYSPSLHLSFSPSLFSTTTTTHLELEKGDGWMDV